jgi:uncharacterized protein YhfF
MNEENKSVVKMWKEYLATISESLEETSKTYEAWSFGGSEKTANALSKLVLEGRKTATSSLHCLYGIESENVPAEGDYSIIIDGNVDAQCVLQTTEVMIMPFNEVTEEFARAEGEGDLSLDYWREVHREFFTDGLKEFNRDFEESMLVVCEVFELVHT